MRRPWLLILLAGLAVAGKDEKDKKDRKDGPRVVMAAPLGLAAGASARITFRGLKLDSATGLKFPDGKLAGKIVSQGKAAPGNMQEPARVGDTQVAAEITVPATQPLGPVVVVIQTPTGETAPYKIWIEDKSRLIAEKEPNRGFEQAQPIRLPQTVDGVIDPAQDVDVFRFEGKAGQRIVCDVLAARAGSALDSFLTLYDADGHEVAANDDFGDSTDSRLEVSLPRGGVYYLALGDSHDHGGPTHPYRLTVRDAGPPPKK